MPGHRSHLWQQVGQLARNSQDPQVAPLHKTMSTQTEPPRRGKICTCMIRSSARRCKLHICGTRSTKEIQMVSTQEETPQRKEGCVLKGKASAKIHVPIYTDSRFAKSGRQNKCRTVPTLETKTAPTPGTMALLGDTDSHSKDHSSAEHRWLVHPGMRQCLVARGCSTCECSSSEPPGALNDT